MLNGPYSFPHVAPLALLRIGDGWVSFVPGELTTTAGRRIVQTVRETTGASHAVVAGLANEYIQYVTTSAEYDLQYYEGASTLYGRHTAEFLRENLQALAASIVDPSTPPVTWNGDRIGEARSLTYDPGPVRARLPRGTRGSGRSSATRRELGLCTLPGDEPRSLCFWWADDTPGNVPLGRGPWVSLVDAQDVPVVTKGEPLVLPNLHEECHADLPPLPSSWSAADPRASIDDTGLDFQTRAHGYFGTCTSGPPCSVRPPTNGRTSRRSVRRALRAGG